MLRKQLTYPRGGFARAQGVYQKLRIHGRAISHTIHTAARIYAQAQPIMRDAGIDTAVMDRGLSKGYEAYKMLEDSVKRDDRAVNQVAQFIRPEYQMY